MISVIIPVYNAHEMTRDCIEAIHKNTPENQYKGEQYYEIIIVDNGSDPVFSSPFPLEKEGITQFRDMGGMMSVIRNETNLGFPVAVNQGIKAAKGDVIVLLNNDVTVPQGWSERLLAHLDTYSIVGPVTNFAAGMQSVTIPVYQDEREFNLQAEKWAETHKGESQEVNWIIGFCMAFKKSLWEEIGPFDESLWPCSGEELSFCLKARERGHRIGIARDVYVHHEGSKTFNEMEKAGQVDYLKICKRNEAHVSKMYPDFWNRQKVIPEVTEGIRLNMGCGDFPMKDFINVDQFESVHPDLLCDVTKLPFESGTVSEIYAGHILEHFRFDEGQKVLRYWFSLLKEGGVISVVIPDFDFLVKEYAKNPSPERLIIFNDVYIYSGNHPSPHQYAYSGDLLKKVMLEAGFKNLKRMPVDHHYFPFPVEWQTGYRGVK